MKDIINLEDLLMAQLQHLHAAELQWANVSDLNIARAHAPTVKELLGRAKMHCQQHAGEVQAILEGMGANIRDRKQHMVDEISKEIGESEKRCADPDVYDAALILNQQCMNHYFIAKYGTLSSFARLLQSESIASRLHSILVEEKTEDELLTKIAEGKINPRAKAPVVL